MIIHLTIISLDIRIGDLLRSIWQNLDPEPSKPSDDSHQQGQNDCRK